MDRSALLCHDRDMEGPTVPSLDAALQILRADRRLEAERAGERIVVRRKRIVPSRGIFRLLIPHVTARVRRTPSGLLTSIRPDAVGVFMFIMLIGGVLVELTMDRARYPRSYPAAFVYGLTALYVVLFVLELVRTRTVVRGVLEREHKAPAFGGAR